MTTALHAGSFDPVHRGHLALITTAAGLFDVLVVAVLGNPDKPSGLLTVPERLTLLEQSTAHLSNVRCTAHHGLTVDAARAAGATVIVRAAHKDRGNELVMAATNRSIASIDTAFVPTDPATTWISSTVVRSLLERDLLDAACELVPPPVATWIRTARTMPI